MTALQTGLYSRMRVKAVWRNQKKALLESSLDLEGKIPNSVEFWHQKSEIFPQITLYQGFLYCEGLRP